VDSNIYKARSTETVGDICLSVFRLFAATNNALCGGLWTRSFADAGPHAFLIHEDVTDVDYSSKLVVLSRILMY